MLGNLSVVAYQPPGVSLLTRFSCDEPRPVSRSNKAEALENRLRLYPNPNNGAFTVEYDAEKASEVHVRLTDLGGRAVFSKTYDAAPGGNRFDLDAALPAGVYVLEVRAGGAGSFEKVVVR